MMYSSDGMGLLLNLETQIGELDKMMQGLNNLIIERKKSLNTAEVKWILNNESRNCLDLLSLEESLLRDGCRT